MQIGIGSIPPDPGPRRDEILWISVLQVAALAVFQEEPPRRREGTSATPNSLNREILILIAKSFDFEDL